MGMGEVEVEKEEGGKVRRGYWRRSIGERGGSVGVEKERRGWKDWK